MREITIGGRRITEDGYVYVVAEVGGNHGGNLDTALELCSAARAVGCDAVKFQKRTVDKIYSRKFLDTPYNSHHAFGATYGEHRHALEFDYDQYSAIQDHCREIGIQFFATAWDQEAADFLEQLDVPVYKIASADIRNLPLIEHVAAKGKPMIISTGGATVPDVNAASAAVRKHGNGHRLAFLHCVALYPTPADEVNLMAIPELQRILPREVIGFSCHFNGISAATLSASYGAMIVEKHFTLDHTAKGSDNAMSLQKDGMRKLVRDLHRSKAMHGTGRIERLPGEAKALEKMEKVLYPTRVLTGGHVLEAGDLEARSPAQEDAFQPWQMDSLIGMDTPVGVVNKALVREVTPDAPLTKDDVCLI